MRSARLRLPSFSTLFTSWVTSGELNTGSETSGRLGAGPLRGMSALLLLRAVAAARLLAVLHALRVQRATHDLVAHAGQVLHTAAADQDDRVLLEVVALTRDVSGDLHLAGELDAGDLAQRGVRLLRRGRVHARAHAAALGTPLERGRLRLGGLVLTALADQLLDRGHEPSTSSRRRAVLLVCACRPHPRSGVSHPIFSGAEIGDLAGAHGARGPGRRTEAASGTQIGPTAVERKTQGYPARRRRVKTGPCRRLSVQAGCPKASSDRKWARPFTARTAPFVVRSVTGDAPFVRPDGQVAGRLPSGVRLSPPAAQRLTRFGIAPLLDPRVPLAVRRRLLDLTGAVSPLPRGARHARGVLG